MAAMSPIVVCPHCHAPVASPKKGTPGARVRCPLCRTNFELRRARDFSPPRLMLISSAKDETRGPVDEEQLTAVESELEFATEDEGGFGQAAPVQEESEGTADTYGDVALPSLHLPPQADDSHAAESAGT